MNLNRSHTSLTILALAALSLASCQDPSVRSTDALPESRADYAEAGSRLSAFIERERARHDLAAVSIALVDDDGVAWAAGFGEQSPGVPATAQTVYRVGSVSKLFTDIAIMQLAERDEIDIDAPVRTYLPDFAPDNRSGTSITLRQLMSHRAGLIREPPIGNYFDASGPDLTATVASLTGVPLVYEPESRVKYSNAGIAVVGHVLEQTQDEPFARYMQRTLLDPLGMTSSSFARSTEVERNLADAVMWGLDRPYFDAPTFELGMSPAGSMYSTVLDLAGFMGVMFRRGTAADGSARILGAETLESMWEPQFANPDATSGYGLGFAVDQRFGQRWLGHGGAIYGFSTQLSFLPDASLGVVVTSAVDGTNAFTGQVADFALELMLAVENDGAMPPDPPGTELVPASTAAMLEGADDDELPPLPPAHFRGLIGEYGPDHNVLYILERAGRLHALIEWFYLYPLDEVSRDVYAFPDRGLYHGEHLVFSRDAADRATSVIAASMELPRRDVGTEAGGTFRIDPVRPVAELRAEALAASPPDEAGPFRDSELIEVTELEPGIRLDVRYATTNNFMSSVFYDEPRVFLQRPAAEAVARAHRALAPYGYGLLLHDGYRPWYVTKMFYDATPESQKLFVADPASGSRHNRGSAIDLNLFDLETGEPADMVGTYDEFSPRSFPDYPGGTSRQRWLHELLRRVMEAEGFTVYEAEWWHFDHEDWREYAIQNATFGELGR